MTTADYLVSLNTRFRLDNATGLSFCYVLQNLLESLCYISGTERAQILLAKQLGKRYKLVNS